MLSFKNRLFFSLFRRILICMAFKIAQWVQELRQFFCITGFYLFVELHQDGSVPLTCAVGLFSLYIEKNIYVAIFLFLLAGSHYSSNWLGLSKTNLCFVLHLLFLAKVWILKIFNQEPKKNSLPSFKCIFFLLISWNSFYNSNSS